MNKGSVLESPTPHGEVTKTVFLYTTEDSGIDRYSQELARHLPVSVLRTKRYKLGLRGYSLVRKLSSLNKLVHFPSPHFGRYSIFGSSPFLLTVHDLERMCFPFARESVWERVGLKLDALAIKRASHIITVSENTKHDLIKLLGVPEKKITVIYNGVNHSIFHPNGFSPSSLRYILYVGSERPRKNLRRLLLAFAELKKTGQFPELKLVKVGSAGRSASFRQATLKTLKELNLEDEVIFVEGLSDQELARYYSSATMLVYPSLYEGFGLPVLEAMASGCPVITSNVSSLPEVAGEAALFVDPCNDNDLCKAMARLLSDDFLRGQLVAKGLSQSKQFSWERSARETIEVYRSVGESSPALAQPKPQMYSSYKGSVACLTGRPSSAICHEQQQTAIVGESPLRCSSKVKGQEPRVF
ncbi:MAG: glycosyltransferase family 1 protein [Chloroflexota bacterium]